MSLTFSLVFSFFYFIWGFDLILSLLIGSLSVATSPAATVEVVKETKAKGLFINTLMPVVAINNITAIIFFGFLISLSGITLDTHNITKVIYNISGELLIDILTGITAGYIIRKFAEKKITSDKHVLTVTLLSIVCTTGFSILMDINSMLPAMFIGIYIINTSVHRDRILSVFEEVEQLIIILFFTTAGAHMQLENLADAGLVASFYFIIRALSKIGGGFLSGVWLNIPKRITKNIGFSLVSQAGVVIGLIVMARNSDLDPNLINFLNTFILASVAINEIIGPLLARWSIQKSGDANQDRKKLIEFLQEEYIAPNLKSSTKNEAILEMINFFISSHKGSDKYKQEIVDSVFEREAEISTGIGSGIAIPHATVKEGPTIWGAIGISNKGISYDSHDNKPVHLIVLIVTPINQKADTHLIVLKEISRLLSNKEIRNNLFKATNSHEIFEIFREEENKNFNYFLDE